MSESAEAPGERGEKDSEINSEEGSERELERDSGVREDARVLSDAELAARGGVFITESIDAPPSGRLAALPFVGDRLRERFLLLRELGAGRSGVVFLARDEINGREVAIKVLRHPSALDRFRREYRRLCDLAHPNVVTALELFAEDEPAFIVMPHVDGEHLDRALLALPAQKKIAAARELFGQLGLALAALHAVGLVHRDVKPSNVLVSDDARVRLVDFGLVSRSESADNALYGTPAYVAPELVGGAPAAPASDWYSFGAMLYQALSLQLPFYGALDEVLERKQAEDAPPLSPEIIASSGGLAELAMALLRRDPEARPLAREILEVLGAEEELTPPSLFFGRERELSELSELYESASMGEPRAIEILGPSGIGKSSLAARFIELMEGKGPPEEVIARAHRAGDPDEPLAPPLVLRSLCYENEHGSFKALDELLIGLFDGALSLKELEGRGGHGAAIESDPFGTSLGELLASRLHDLSEARPIILLIDQLQWADADSARVLAEVWPLLEGARVLFLFATREDQRALSPFIRHLDDHLPALLARKLRLGPLEPEESEELIRQLSGQSSVEPSASSALEASGGNPMILSWMVRGEGSLLASDDEAREVGAWIALAGHPVSLEVLERGIAGADVAGASRRLEAHRFVKKSAHRGAVMLTPVHDWMQTQLLRGLAPERAREIHRGLGAALESAPTSTPEEIGAHYYRAAEYAAMLPHAEQAASKAREIGAHSAEALWIERILEGGASLRVDRIALRLRAAAAHAAGGWGREAAAHYHALAEKQRGSVAREAELRLLAAEQLFRCGEWERGYHELRDVLARLGLPLPRSKASLLAQLIFTRLRLRGRNFDAPMRPDDELSELTIVRLRAYSVATLAHIAHDPLVGAYYASQHLLLTLRERAGQRLLRALGNELGMITGQGGARAERETPRLVEKIKLLAREEQSEEDRLYAEMMLGIVPLQAGRFDEASASFRASERRLAESAVRVPWELTICRMLLLTSDMFHRGLGGEIHVSINAWLEEARIRRDDGALRYLLIKRVLSHLADDDIEGAHATVAEAKRLLLAEPRAVDMDGATHLNMRVFLAFYEGRVDRPLLRSLRAELERVLRSNIASNRGLKATAASLIAGLLLIERAGGTRTEKIDRRIARIERLLLADGGDYSLGFARMITATLAHQRGADGEAIATLEEAKAAFKAAGMRPAYAVALARQGQLIGGEEGERAIAEGSSELVSLGVRDPSRYLRVHAPGFEL